MSKATVATGRAWPICPPLLLDLRRSNGLAAEPVQGLAAVPSGALRAVNDFHSPARTRPLTRLAEGRAAPPLPITALRHLQSNRVIRPRLDTGARARLRTRQLRLLGSGFRMRVATPHPLVRPRLNTGARARSRTRQLRLLGSGLRARVATPHPLVRPRLIAGARARPTALLKCGCSFLVYSAAGSQPAVHSAPSARHRRRGRFRLKNKDG